LSNDKLYSYNFISDNEFYTVFVPTDEALDSAGVNTMPVDELRNFLLFHFVQGNIIFTDGKMPAQYYETARIDEKSTEYTTIYSKLYLNPGVDLIQIRDKNGSVYTEIEEAEDVTNLMAGVSGGTGDEVFPVLYVNAAIHQIDKALMFEELDTE